MDFFPFILRGTCNFLVFLSFPIAVHCVMPQVMKSALEVGQSGVASLQRLQEEWRPFY